MCSTQTVLKIHTSLRQLRKIVLGLDTPLDRFLPSWHRKEHAQEQARYLADRIVFFAGCADQDMDPETMHDLHCWMYEIILYLKIYCMKDDETLGSILDLFQRCYEVRKQIFGQKDLFPHVSGDFIPPILEEDLEEIFYEMAAQVCDLQTRWQRLQSFVNALQAGIKKQ